MVTELKEVLLKAEQLKEEEQKRIAGLLQQEILWEATFEASQNQLATLADGAIHEYKSGKTIQTDW